MEILHKRIANVRRGTREYCIGHVYIDGVYSHDSIEDLDRGLNEDMSDKEVARRKVKDRTAIPTGTYLVKLNVLSRAFGGMPFYKTLCGGRLPRLDPVVGFQGILIHCGRNEGNSSGCIIVGRNKVVGEVTDSKAVFETFYRKIKAAYDSGERITYRIERTYKV